MSSGFNSVQFTSQEILLNQTFRQSAAIFFGGLELGFSGWELGFSGWELGFSGSQPLKKTAANCNCWNIWFNNISWLVNCTELKLQSYMYRWYCTVWRKVATEGNVPRVLQDITAQGKGEGRRTCNWTHWTYARFKLTCLWTCTHSMELGINLYNNI